MSIVVIARWVASMVRMEAMRSTMARAGSTPEPSREPDLTVPVAWPPAWPVKFESPCLTGLRRLKSATLVGSMVPSVTVDGLAADAEDLVAELVDEVALARRP